MTVVVDFDGVRDVGIVTRVSDTQAVIEFIDGTSESWMLNSMGWRTSKQIMSSPLPGYRLLRLRAVKFVFGDYSR